MVASNRTRREKFSVILFLLTIIYTGDRDKALKDLELLPYPAEKVYYRGVFEKDPLKAMKFFNRLISKYPESQYMVPICSLFIYTSS